MTQPDLKSFLNWAKERHIDVIELRFTDIAGYWRQITVSPAQLEETQRRGGPPVNGLLIPGWNLPSSGGILRIFPDYSTAFIDFLVNHKAVLICNIIDSYSGLVYNRDPRGLLQRAVKSIKKQQAIDSIYVKLRVNFYLLNKALDNLSQPKAESFMETEELSYNYGPTGVIERGLHDRYYYMAAPIDTGEQVRTAIKRSLASMNVQIAEHHHGIGSNLHEMVLEPMPILAAADALQTLKYTTKIIAAQHGKVATFMPHPMTGCTTNAIPVNFGLYEQKKPLFTMDKSGNWSRSARHFLGGILRHVGMLQSFVMPSVNSYKRFPFPVGGYGEDPLASASLDVTYPELGVKFLLADGAMNPYLGLAALILAGIDGITHHCDPGPPLTHTSSLKHAYGIVATTLSQTLKYVNDDWQFLTRYNVFSHDFFNAYTKLKLQDQQSYHQTVHPWEIQQYFTV
jgi:glutamine synthetase